MVDAKFTLGGYRCQKDFSEIIAVVAKTTLGGGYKGYFPILNAG